MDISFLFTLDNDYEIPKYGKLIISGILENKYGLDVYVKSQLREVLNIYRRKHNMPEVFSLGVGILGTTDYWSSPTEYSVFDIYINCDKLLENSYFVYNGEKIYIEEEPPLENDIYEEFKDIESGGSGGSGSTDRGGSGKNDK